MSRLLVSVVTTVLVVAALAPGAIGGAAADDVTLTVTVVGANGQTLGDIPISVTWNDGNGGPKNQTTAPNGQALFGVPDGADVQIYINDDRYMRNFPYAVENVTDQSVTVPVSLSGQATVTVEDASGPVEDANVWVFRDARYVDTRQTGPDGTSTTAQLERGGYGLEVRKAGYVTNKTSLFIGPGMNNETVQIRRGNVEVQFNVTDDTFETPRPIENATVNIQGGASLPTLSNGFASTTVAVNREYTVTVSKDGYESATRTVQVGETSAMLNVSIRRTDAISVEASNDRVVVGESTQVTVTDEYGERVAGATVSAADSTVGETDANGQLSVPIDSAGNTTITVEANGLSASTVVEGVEAAANPTATATPTNATSTETPGDNGPGFGIVPALVALVAILLVARRR